ncbi:MAG: helix-turn-helix domain-containing protein [Pseudomonadota bacterium]|nr:helix-turn-helix domain-containing protein [Pseudomonadota bacterium]
MSNVDELRQQANQIEASCVLGKPGALSRLFEYLLNRSLAGEAPKEAEIAMQVFGKGLSFDVAQDATVRVYVHKLRRRLDDYYAGLRTPQASRIAVPKGEYRLVIEPHRLPTDESLQRQEASTRPWRKQLLVAATLVAGFVAGALLMLWLRPATEDAQLQAVRDSPIWGPLLKDQLPITIVVGDYYMLGETDHHSDHIQRLVREFSINSDEQFLQQLEASPGLMKHYRNLNFTYLPTSIAFALQHVLPVLSARKPVRVMLMSELHGDQLAGSHLVYLGFLSGMGVLADPTLASSRVAVGGTYDELIDMETNVAYLSTAADTRDSRYMDYGFLSTFPGPGNNRIVIIAGTRDTGLTRAAEMVTSRLDVADIAKGAGAAESFESLFEVYGVARAGMNSKLLFVSPLDTSRIWAMNR